MLKKIVTLIVVLLSLNGCSSSPTKDKHSVSVPIFTVQFVQNGKTMMVVDSVVVLDKKPFSVIVRFKKPDGVLVNASFDSSTYSMAREGESIDKLLGFQGTGIAEFPLNPNRMIFLSTKSANYWNYNSDEDNRFNIVKQGVDEIVCQRDIDYVVDLDNSKKRESIEQMKGSDLYFVFIQSRWTDDYSRRIEIGRESYHLQFRSSLVYIDLQETIFNN